MTITVIVNDPDGYTLTSFGNGWAYALSGPYGDDVWVQDDAANDFRQELDDLTGPTGLQLHMQDALEAIWCNFH